MQLLLIMNIWFQVHIDYFSMHCLVVYFVIKLLQFVVLNELTGDCNRYFVYMIFQAFVRLKLQCDQRATLFKNFQSQ